MPKSKRNKTVDLSKTKKHGLEGKKELFKKIQSNVENYAHVFVFAVNDMRNSKMKNVREQWKHSRFCIGKNKVMAMALGRTPEEEYRPNLHKVGQMLVGERGLLFTNQSVEEVTNWFESYSEGDYARSGNVATEDVILPEGPLPQFPHSLESYLRQLGLPTTLKKGIIHLVKEHVVCTEGDRLSPETAKILKLLGYEMAEFRLRILSVWSQDGSFINLQSNGFDSEFKENIVSPQKSQNDANCFENDKAKNMKNSDSTTQLEMEVAEAENPTNKQAEEPEQQNAKTQDEEKEQSDLKVPTSLETEDVEMEEDSQEPEIKKHKNDSTVTKSTRKTRKTAKTEEQLATNQQDEIDQIDSAAVLKMTESKLQESAEKPKKFSPKMTRARAAAENKKIKTPEPLETKRSNRKRKM